MLCPRFCGAMTLKVRPTPRSGRFRGPGESKPPGVFGSFSAEKEQKLCFFAKEEICFFLKEKVLSLV